MAAEAVTIQLPPDAAPELIERVKAAFPEATLAEPDAPVDPEAQVAAAEEAVAAALASAPRLPDLLGAWWAGLPGGGLWVLTAIAVAAFGAYAVERGVRALIPAPVWAGETQAPFAVRLPRGLRWLAGRAAGIALFAVAALALWRITTHGDPALRDLARGVLIAIVRVRLTFAFISALTAPKAPGRRLMGFTDAEAATAWRAGAVLTAVNLALSPPRAAVIAAAGEGPETALARLAFAAVATVAAIWFFIRVADPVRRLLWREIAVDPAAVSRWAQRLALRWHWVFLAALALDLTLKALGVLGLLGGPAVSGAGAAMLSLITMTLAVAGLRVLRAETPPEARTGLRLGLFSLAEGVAILVGGLAALSAWGLDPFAPAGASGLARYLPGLVEAAIVVAAGFALWRAAAAILSAPPSEPSDDEIGGDEGAGKKGSRLDTILPVLRGFAMALIGVTTLFMALSALGMNIAPLLASAGVVGLAIGFGAQRMVADVISGLLYLYEDAFRVGEYIEVSGGKGVVERISIRSVRLRHPRGPVFTIPFSSMGTVQNHSRDWATLKFSFMVPSDTDVEMVRKLVKKVGEQLMSEPELQGKILAPLKSQGAVAIAGAAYTIGIKFTAVPGEQFVIRRRAFAALQKALKEKGIELYRPELTVSQLDPSAPPEAEAAR